MRKVFTTNNKEIMKATLPLTLSVLIAMFASGCAQVMAIKQPKPFVPTSLVQGAKRADIVTELGQPLTSEEHNGTLSDSYKYVDGGKKNSGGSKTGRIVLYTAGDVFTLWLDQIVWMPTEKFGFSGTDHDVRVDYTKFDDQLWHAKQIDNRILKGSSEKKEAF